MSFHCVLSNEIPEQPVVSPHSGSIFEKRLIVKYLEENGKDPVTGKAMSVDELIEIKTEPSIKPKAPSATSIPALLKCLQDEYDSVVLHSYNLRQQLSTTRQELSYTMYQHDASNRVIARLTKELNAARDALSTMKPRGNFINNNGSQNYTEEDQNGAKHNDIEEEQKENEAFVNEQLAKILQNSQTMSSERKARFKNVPSNVKRVHDLQEYKAVSSQTSLHSVSKPGIIALDLCQENPNKIVTGGMDYNAVVYDKQSEEIVSVLKGHTKKVNCVGFVNENTVVTGSADSYIRVWNVTDAATKKVIHAHENLITSLDVHPMKQYLVSTSNDQEWVLSDIERGQVMLRMGESDVNYSLNVAKFHPDGLLIATGTSDSLIKIWELNSRRNILDFPGHSGGITTIAFCENAYYMATASEDGCVKVWDLRKGKNVKTIQFEENYQIKDIAFDNWAQYMAVAGNDVRVYICKQWDNIKTFGDHTAAVTGVRFGPTSEFIVSSSMDRSVKVFA